MVSCCFLWQNPWPSGKSGMFFQEFLGHLHFLRFELPVQSLPLLGILFYKFYLFVCLLFIYYYCLWDTVEPGWLIKESSNTGFLPNCPGCKWPKVWILFGYLGAAFSVICSQSLSLVRMSLGFYEQGENALVWLQINSSSTRHRCRASNSSEIRNCNPGMKAPWKNTYFIPPPFGIIECHWSQ